MLAAPGRLGLPGTGGGGAGAGDSVNADVILAVPVLGTVNGEAPVSLSGSFSGSDDGDDDGDDDEGLFDGWSDKSILQKVSGCVCVCVCECMTVLSCGLNKHTNLSPLSSSIFSHFSFYTTHGQFLTLASLPPVVACTLSIPVVNDSAWNKPLACWHLLFCPLFILFVVGEFTTNARCPVVAVGC